MARNNPVKDSVPEYSFAFTITKGPKKDVYFNHKLFVNIAGVLFKAFRNGKRKDFAVHFPSSRTLCITQKGRAFMSLTITGDRWLHVIFHTEMTEACHLISEKEMAALNQIFVKDMGEREREHQVFAYFNQLQYKSMSEVICIYCDDLG